MNLKYYILLLLSASLMCSCGGDSVENVGNRPVPIEPPTPPSQGDIPDREGATVKGFVKTQGQAISGAVVSDGVNVTKTDDMGRYWLRTDLQQSQFVMLSIPSGYEVQTLGAMPQFYAQLDRKADNVQQHDFTLTKVDNDNHVMVVMTDMHIAGRKPSNGPLGGSGTLDSVQFKSSFQPDLNATLRTIVGSRCVYGLNLGDMTHDVYWTRNNVSFPQYKHLVRGLGFPIFHAIGNHDYDPSVTDLSQDDSAAEAAYKTHLGPTYYSFNLGTVHYIVLDDVQYINLAGARNYSCTLSERQLAWLRKDMSNLASNVKRIVVALHIPTQRRNPIANQANQLTNRAELYSILSGYPVTILSGHAHFAETVNISPSITEYVHSSVCGCWWYVNECTDGSPSGYALYHNTAGSAVRQIKGIGLDIDEQCRVYNSAITDNSGKPAVLLNIWGWSQAWRITAYENGVSVAVGEMVRAYDLRFQQLYNDKYVSNTEPSNKPYYTDHMYRYTPRNADALLKFILSDDQGREFVVNTKIE